MDILIKDDSLIYKRIYEEELIKVGFFKNVKIPEKENLSKIAIKTFMAFSILGASVFTLSVTKDTLNKKEDITKEALEITIPQEVIKKEIKNQSLSFNINNTKLIYKDEKEIRLKKISNFNLPVEMKINNYPKAIAEYQLNNGEYYLALLSYAEGFSPSIKPDNKGYIIGFGWNLTLNSMKNNEHIAKVIGMSKSDIETLRDLSHESDKNVSINQLKSVEISPQQAIQAAHIMGEQIRTEKVIPGIQRVLIKHRNLDKKESLELAIKTFNSLGRHQQDMIVYHGYKAGNKFLTFKNFVLNVVDYALISKKITLKEKHEFKSNIVKELDYSFKKDGKRYLDIRAQEITGAMFMGPNNFAKKYSLKMEPENIIAKPLKI